MKKQDLLKSRAQKSGVPFFKEGQAVSSPPPQAGQAVLKLTPDAADNPGTGQPPPPPPARNLVPFASAAAAACLLLVLAPLLPRYFGPHNREVASFSCPPTDGECLRKVRRRCSEKKEEYPRYLKCQKKVWNEIKERRAKKSQYKKLRVMHLIKTGHRKVASVGSLPRPLDVFSVEVLNSRYEVQSRGRRVKLVTLLEGSQPIPLPDMEKTFKEFASLFPSHKEIRKHKGHPQQGGEGRQVYELLNVKRNVVSEVVVITDNKDRLLSLKVQGSRGF